MRRNRIKLHVNPVQFSGLSEVGVQKEQDKKIDCHQENRLQMELINQYVVKPKVEQEARGSHRSSGQQFLEINNLEQNCHLTCFKIQK